MLGDPKQVLGLQNDKLAERYHETMSKTKLLVTICLDRTKGETELLPEGLVKTLLAQFKKFILDNLQFFIN